MPTLKWGLHPRVIIASLERLSQCDHICMKQLELAVGTIFSQQIQKRKSEHLSFPCLHVTMSLSTLAGFLRHFDCQLHQTEWSNYAGLLVASTFPSKENSGIQAFRSGILWGGDDASAKTLEWICRYVCLLIVCGQPCSTGQRMHRYHIYVIFLHILYSYIYIYI